MWFESGTPLRSGVGLGPELPRRSYDSLRGHSASDGYYAFGPEITFRAQPHGTFKFLFNGI